MEDKVVCMKNKVALNVGILEIELTQADIQCLSKRYVATDTKSAKDSLHTALWGCGCCEEWDISPSIKNGICWKITEAVAGLIDK